MLILNGFKGIKVFLVQIYCLFVFRFDIKTCYSNENIYGTSLMFAFFSFDIKGYYRNENVSGANLLLVSF